MKQRPRHMRIWRDLAGEKPMVFMAGPRQTGKTTLAQMITAEYINHLYFNWDNPQDRTRLIENPFFFQQIERRNGSPFIADTGIFQARTLSFIVRNYPSVHVKSETC